MTKLRGPKFISEMLAYECPFTERTVELHPSQWPKYIERESKKHTLVEIQFAHYQCRDPFVRKILEAILLYHHNSVEQ